MVKEEIKDPDFNKKLSEVKERVSILEAQFYQFNTNVEMSVEMIKQSEKHFNNQFRTILIFGTALIGGTIAIIIRLFTSWSGSAFPSNMPAP